MFGGAALTATAVAEQSSTPDYSDPDVIYGLLRQSSSRVLKLGSRRIRIVFAPGPLRLDRALIAEWIERAADAVAGYFGHYPVAEHQILVVAEEGPDVGHATTYGYRGPATRISVGTGADRAAFARDWVLVHEMLHTALPNLPRSALWLQEGNATYVEPIVRAQAGLLAPAELWRETLAGMPRGLASPDAGGMDGTRSWGRLYWGGAIFWLFAEIAIYSATRGAKDLRAALRAVNERSGGNGVIWTPEQLVQTADSSLGLNLLTPLYHGFARGPVDVDLEAVFRRLGVEETSAGEMVFTDSAPFARLRRRLDGTGA